MRKSTLLSLLATLCLVPAHAQLSSLPGKTRAGEGAASVAQTVTAPVAQLANGVATAPARITPLTTEPVLDQPGGTFINASRDGTGYFVASGAVYPYSTHALASGYVMEEGDSVIWLKDPYTQYVGQQGWLKLERQSPTSSYYVAKLPQAIVAYDDTTTLYATKLTGTRNGSYSVSTNQIVRFRMSNKGVLTQVTSNGTEIIGLTNIGGGWLGYGDYAYKLSSNYDTPNVSPQWVPKEKFVWRNITAKDGSTTFDGMVNVGFDGDTVYISNCADTTQYFKGVIHGDKAVFKTPQYLGKGNAMDYLLYFQGARYNWTDPTRNPAITLLKDSVTLAYDSLTHTFTIPNQQALLFTINNADSMYTHLSPEVTIFPFVERAATPQPPYFWEPQYYFSNYEWSDRLQMGFGRAYIVVMPYDLDGNYLDPAKLYYSMYIDDGEEPFVFDQEDYPNLTEEMTEIPFYFTDNYGITVQSDILRLIAFFTEVQDSIGFQTIYYGGDERHASAIEWYYPNGTDGIGKVATGGVGGAKAFYDVAGRRQEGLRKGINIVRKEDGSVVKVLR